MLFRLKSKIIRLSLNLSPRTETHRTKIKIWKIIKTRRCRSSCRNWWKATKSTKAKATTTCCFTPAKMNSTRTGSGTTSKSKTKIASPAANAFQPSATAPEKRKKSLCIRRKVWLRRIWCWTRGKLFKLRIIKTRKTSRRTSKCSSSWDSAPTVRLRWQFSTQKHGSSLWVKLCRATSADELFMLRLSLKIKFAIFNKISKFHRPKFLFRFSRFHFSCIGKIIPKFHSKLWWLCNFWSLKFQCFLNWWKRAKTL